MKIANLWSPRGLRSLVVGALLSGASCGGELGEPTPGAAAVDTAQEALLAACSGVRSDAPLAKRPVDIIVVVDNSGSMTDEIVAIQNNINRSFADTLSRSGLDYRVILVASHGDAVSRQSVCVAAPLSTNPTCSPVPARPGLNPPRFYQYSIEIESTDSLQRLLNSYNGVERDQFGLAPLGWSQWLRSDAFKVFIEITDDNSALSETLFDAQLLAKTPQQFGDASSRNYAFYTIGGFKENSPATKAWEPTDPLQTALCTAGGGAVNPSTVYQRLSILTGGLRFPICQYASFDAVFTNVASGVVSGARVACDFPLPTAPVGEKLDPSTVRLEYTPMGTGAVTPFAQVASAAACAPNSFYLDKDRVVLCPDSCSLLQKDSKAKVEVIYDCLTRPNGSACATGSQCGSTFCVDGVCCDAACGGGVDGDCQVCSKAKGAATDGTCGLAAPGTTCRPAAGPCDGAEVCSGASASCPVDKLKSSSTTCRPAAGPCDTADKCSGTSALCPADKLKTNTTVCRSASGPCDLAEFCSGTSVVCPADQFKPIIAICRPAAGACDLVDYCTGASPACPPDDFVPGGTVCRAAVSSCDQDEICSGTRAACPADQPTPDGTTCPGGTCKAGMCI